jgi:hypothetical protein
LFATHSIRFRAGVFARVRSTTEFFRWFPLAFFAPQSRWFRVSIFRTPQANAGVFRWLLLTFFAPQSIQFRVSLFRIPQARNSFFRIPLRCCSLLIPYGSTSVSSLVVSGIVVSDYDPIHRDLTAHHRTQTVSFRFSAGVFTPHSIRLRADRCAYTRSTTDFFHLLFRP